MTSHLTLPFPINGHRFDTLQGSPDDAPLETGALAQLLAYPKSTTLRVLEDLTGHRLVRRFPDGKSHKWELSSLSIDLLTRAQANP